MDPFLGWGDEIAYGAWITMLTAVLSLGLGLVWGMLGALAQLARNRLVAALGRGFSLVMRGTPELLLILIVYFGGTMALTRAFSLFSESKGFIEVPPLQAGVFALSLVFGGYAAEVIRGAWIAVPTGVIEAARTLGLRPLQIFLHVRLPLMLRHALPGLGNNWVSLIKDTSLISVVGLHDLMGYATMATSVTREPFRYYMIVALIYFALTMTNSRLVGWLEQRARRGDRRVTA